MTGCLDIWFVDADGDGQGDPAHSIVACTAPSGYVDNDGDCYDGNQEAHPAQLAHFAVQRGDGSFDYDCDGQEEPASSKLATCPDLTSETCPPPEDQLPSQTCDYVGQAGQWQHQANGWYPSVPACGVAGLQGLEVTWNPIAKMYWCAPPDQQTSRIQECR